MRKIKLSIIITVFILAFLPFTAHWWSLWAMTSVRLALLMWLYAEVSGFIGRLTSGSSSDMQIEFFPLSKLKWFNIFAYVFIISLVISSVFSVDRYNSLTALLDITAASMMFLIAQRALKEESYQELILSMVRYIAICASFLVLAQNLMQGFFNMGIHMWFFGQNPNITAGYLTMAFPLIVLPDKKAFWPSSRVLRGIFIAIMITGMLLTRCRSAIAVSASVTAAVYAFVYKKNIFKQYWYIFMISAIFFGVVTVLKTNYSDIINRISWLRYAITLFGSRWLVGWGLNTYGELVRFLGNGARLSLFTHNIALQTAAESGITGLVASLGLLAVLARHYVSGQGRIKRSCVWVGVLSILILNMADYSLMVPVNMYTFAALLGIALPAGTCPAVFRIPQSFIAFLNRNRTMALMASTPLGESRYLGT